MMRFDHSGFSAQAALYHIRINSSLRQEVYGADLLCLFLKHTDEFLADNLTLLLRLCHTGQLAIISFLCIDTDKIQVKIPFRSEDCLYFVPFIFSEEAMINKYTGQLLSDSSGKKSCCHRRIHAAG